MHELQEGSAKDAVAHAAWCEHVLPCLSYQS